MRSFSDLCLCSNDASYRNTIISFQFCCIYMLGVDQREKSTSDLNEKVLMQTSSVAMSVFNTMGSKL